ncbi:substrate-binding domain-containing protein [Chitinimonas arctica]|uniref:substrate-binding domain-containing protein n=1 Tax=Chitinimonas arctica TaxID=2594795 RepID=UPI0015D42812|nr:substrate-binding domain-containing protein [Chitinimonas arctica]
MKGVAGSGVKGSGGMAEAVKQTAGAIGYLDFGRASHDKLAISQLPNRLGVFLKVSTEAIQAAAKFDAERVLYTGDPDFYLVLANNDTYAGWPLATATFVLVPKNARDPQKLLDFLYWGYKNGDGVSRELGYVPLTDTMKIGVRKAWSRQYNYKAGM